MTTRLLLLLAVLSGCASNGTTLETRVRTSLDVLADVVDPSYQLAVDGCIAREADAVRRFEAGSDRARDEYESVKLRCGQVRKAFDLIRDHHARAVSFVENGKLTEAEAEVERVRGFWRSLNLTTTTEPAEGGVK